MFKWWFGILVCLVTLPAQAADYAVIINDAEKTALIQALDEAVKSKGLAIARNVVILVDKITSAPSVTEQKQEEKPKEPAQ